MDKSPRNKTITATDEEIAKLYSELLRQKNKYTKGQIDNKIINADLLQVIPALPDSSIDLLLADPPYNMSKKFATMTFKKTDQRKYETWLESWLKPLIPKLKPTASIYICTDWQASTAVNNILSKYFIVRNRLTWQREKGRGATKNWKNCSEDIWFATMSDEFNFHVDRVKIKKKVIAPYRDEKGKPKDWEDKEDGAFRLTHPSNFIDNISVPFWSMPENTEHPTQKPEKLMAKLILASSEEGDLVFDPFLGSGTTAVVAKKLQRKFSGVELSEKYCCIALKRLKMAEKDKRIQGYENGVFLERNYNL